MQKNNIVVSDDARSTVNTEDIHGVRRANLLLLLREFSQARIASGEPTNGTEKAFAEQLQVSKSLLSQLKTSRPISDANAKQIEARCKKSAGWLSVIRSEEAPRLALGEEAFIALARAAYRNANKEKRAQLRAQFATQR
jgi:hypothetical protein